MISEQIQEKIFTKTTQVLTEVKFLRFLKQLNLPVKDFANIEYFKIQEEIDSKIRAEYKDYVRDFSYTRQKISYTDYLLAFLGHHCGLKVISYDYHLLDLLRRNFEFDCILPEHIYRYPGQYTVLLDTNIILGYPYQSKEVQKKIITMLQNPLLTFLVPYRIIEEVEMVVARNHAKCRKKHNHKHSVNRI